MKHPIRKILSKFKYVIALSIFAIFILFVGEHSWINRLQRKSEIAELNRKIAIEEEKYIGQCVFICSDYPPSDVDSSDVHDWCAIVDPPPFCRSRQRPEPLERQKQEFDTPSLIPPASVRCLHIISMCTVTVHPSWFLFWLLHCEQYVVSSFHHLHCGGIIHRFPHSVGREKGRKSEVRIAKTAP